MPIAAFVCPTRGAGSGTRTDVFRPKFARGDVSIVRVGVLRFGRTDDCIMLIEASQTYLNTIAADPDHQLIATQANIDSALTAGQVSAIQSFLEARGIPADWLVAGETRRQALRGLAGMFLFSQRMEGQYGQSWKQRLVQHGVTLNSEWQTLPLALQVELLTTGATLGYSGGSPSPTTTLRQILKAMGNLFQSKPIEIAGFVL